MTYWLDYCKVQQKPEVSSQKSEVVLEPTLLVAIYR